MKNSVVLKVGNTPYTLTYNIRSLATFERLFGKSLVSVVNNGLEYLLAHTTIDFTSAGLIAGLGLKSEDDAYNLIDEYCSAGGDLDHLNGAIMEAVWSTGLFTPGRTPEPEKPAKKRTKAAKE